jgi:hypothetical protein
VDVPGPTPTVEPTVAPTVAPGPDFWNSPYNPFRDLSPAVQIFLFILIGLAFIGLFVGGGYLWTKLKTRFSKTSFV